MIRLDLPNGNDAAGGAVDVVEDGVTGTFNGVGPRSPMSIAGMLYGIRATVDNEISFTWVDADFLEQHEVAPWMHMTVWVPPVGEYAGFSSSSIQRALDAGLTFRPLADTAKATVDYWNSLPEDRRAARVADGLEMHGDHHQRPGGEEARRDHRQDARDLSDDDRVRDEGRTDRFREDRHADL
mgnify:CR=1 FL=1